MIVIMLLMGIGTYSFYDKTKQQDEALKAKQSDYDLLKGQFDRLSLDYAALTTNLTDLNEQYNTLSVKYENLSNSYNNITDEYSSYMAKIGMINGRIGTFQEDQATLAVAYNVTPRDLPNGAKDILVSATAYNVGKSDLVNVDVCCKYTLYNNTTTVKKFVPYLEPMSKYKAVWELEEGAVIEDIWAATRQ